MKTIHPAIAEHVMEENEKLRAALRKIIERCELFINDEADMRTHSIEALMGIAEDALSQQAEPAPAQDEREAHVPDNVFQQEFQTWWEDHGQFCRSGGGDYERTFAFQAWRHLYPMLLQARATRPAQTEQQPVIVREGWKLVPIEPTDDMIRSAMQYDSAQEPGDDPDLAESLRVDWSLMLDAAPIAQTAQGDDQ